MCDIYVLVKNCQRRKFANGDHESEINEKELNSYVCLTLK